MTEAYKLLNQSIIRVEQPDVYLDEEEADEPAASQDQGKCICVEAEIRGMIIGLLNTRDIRYESLLL